MRRPSEIAIALSLTLAAMAAGYALYSYVGPFHSARVTPPPSVDPWVDAEPEWVAMETEPVGDPVRVANPFDASETFDFPAGTSEADAREAIAGFLIERAANRGVVGAPRHGS